MMGPYHLIICRDLGELGRKAATEFVHLARRCVADKGLFAVALSGGSTPKALYTLLASPPFHAKVPWSKVHLFWGDERCVPPDHPDSNYRMADEAFLSKVPVPRGNIHRMPAEGEDPEAAAAEYEQTLRRFFALGEDELPRFDLILLGMGEDGHTVSLFPGTAVLHERKRLVAAPSVKTLGASRLTLTPPVLNAAANVMFLVSGEGKAKALKDVLQGRFQPVRLPAQLVRPTEGTLLWLVDQAAASLLDVHGDPRISS